MADAIAVLDHLGIERAHVVGLSMGGFATIHLGLKHPARASALVVAGCGYGAPKDARTSFQRETHAVADRLEREGAGPVGNDYALGPDAGAVPDQGPARLGHLSRPAHRPLGQGHGQHAARRAIPPPLALRP